MYDRDTLLIDSEQEDVFCYGAMPLQIGPQDHRDTVRLLQDGTRGHEDVCPLRLFQVTGVLMQYAALVNQEMVQVEEPAHVAGGRIRSVCPCQQASPAP